MSPQLVQTAGIYVLKSGVGERERAAIGQRRTFSVVFSFKEWRMPGQGTAFARSRFSAFLFLLVRSLNALGPRATSGARPTVMNSRNLLPALNEMTVVQVTRQ